MSFLSGLRGMMGGKPDLIEQWIVPESAEQLHKLLEEAERPVLIYKHSFNCGTCMFSKMNVEKLFDDYSDRAIFVFVDVNVQRPISNEIAEFAEVRHESPQVLLFKNGKPVWNESHGTITGAALRRSLEELN
jgi:bacillithiol system protein YtxJ